VVLVLLLLLRVSVPALVQQSGSLPHTGLVWSPLLVTLLLVLLLVLQLLVVPPVPTLLVLLVLLLLTMVVFLLVRMRHRAAVGLILVSGHSPA
jgi:hypothetical protein